ncbi:radical SAM domain protein [Acidilobus saccharovorans 345-15]|uniref:Radical SAM domain protein n=1 Tax=Acidilobus saccharovorans (strain DSM 16705 / JCM 18335 / VKM B-2471 / 345-15) TaxID=666510 RepID=D9Q1G4_ACIS3|nr:SPASM domain-containing protein [Acidilobus saccharovorans]ADL19152.1 radical SAM domain protein [Acidilobus saccharovorans 345-15]
MTPKEAVYVVRRAAELQGRSNLVIAPIGVPWYYAYLASKSGLPLGVSRYFVYGCAAGRGMFYIKPDGEVWPCPFLPVSAGNAAREPASRIWNSPLFRSLRSRDSLQGACGSCRFKEVCGGCRARTYIRHDSPYAEDPLCPLSNGAEDLVRAVEAAEPTPCTAPIVIG